MKIFGSRLEVWRGTAKKTTGGLTKQKLTKNRNGKIVSKTKSLKAKRENPLGKMLTTRKKKNTSEISSANIIKGKRTRRKPKRYGQ